MTYTGVVSSSIQNSVYLPCPHFYKNNSCIYSTEVTPWKDDHVSTANTNIPLSLTDRFIHTQSRTVLKASSSLTYSPSPL